MSAALDALTSAPQPLTARKSVVSSSPAFELPPPGNFAVPNSAPRLQSPSTLNPSPNVSVGNLLSPPANAGESGSQPLPVSGGIPPATDVSTYASGLWQNQNSYNYSTPSQTWSQSAAGLYPPPTRGSLSPTTLSRSNVNAPTTEPMAQTFDLHPPSHMQPSSIPPSSGSTIHSVVPQPVPSHVMTPHPLISTHGVPGANPSSPNMTDSGAKSNPNPMFGTSQPGNSSGSYQLPPSYTGAPSVSHSGLGIQASRVPANPAQSPSVQQPQVGYPRPPWPSYSLPAMAGPVMTNIHNPGGQMSIVGNLHSGFGPMFNSGHLASMQQMYSGHAGYHGGHGQSTPANDRPYKCDQCPQSFNRNHDLKRHKRIHLSVKPFPCTHCDKTFSRKDALKVGFLLRLGDGEQSRTDNLYRGIYSSRAVERTHKKATRLPRMTIIPQRWILTAERLVRSVTGSLDCGDIGFLFLFFCFCFAFCHLFPLRQGGNGLSHCQSLPSYSLKSLA